MQTEFRQITTGKKKKKKKEPPGHSPCQTLLPLPTQDTAGGCAAAPPPVSSTSLSGVWRGSLSIVERRYCMVFVLMCDADPCLLSIIQALIFQFCFIFAQIFSESGLSQNIINIDMPIEIPSNLFRLCQEETCFQLQAIASAYQNQL
jgi:hypothetical protein